MLFLQVPIHCIQPMFAHCVSRYFFPKNDVLVRVICFVEDEPPILSVYLFPKKSLFSCESRLYASIRAFRFSVLISEPIGLFSGNTCGLPLTAFVESAFVPAERCFVLRFTYKLTDAIIGLEYNIAGESRCALCPKWFVFKQLATFHAPFRKIPTLLFALDLSARRYLKTLTTVDTCRGLGHIPPLARITESRRRLPIPMNLDL